MGRAIIAAVVGYAVWTVIWLGAGAVIAAARPDAFATDAMSTDSLALGILLVLSVVCSIAAGVITTRIARTKPMPALWILAVALLLTGIGVQASAWNLMPLWYHIPFLVLIVPVTVGSGVAAKRR